MEFYVHMHSLVLNKVLSRDHMKISGAFSLHKRIPQFQYSLLIPATSASQTLILISVKITVLYLAFLSLHQRSEVPVSRKQGDSQESLPLVLLSQRSLKLCPLLSHAHCVHFLKTETVSYTGWGKK